MMTLTWHIFTFTSNGHQAMMFTFSREGSTCAVSKEVYQKKKKLTAHGHAVAVHGAGSS